MILGLLQTIQYAQSMSDLAIDNLVEQYHSLIIRCHDEFMQNLFENLPQTALQLYEMFQLGLSVGGFKMFSVGFSIVLFQRGSGEMLPLILNQQESALANYPRLASAVSVLTILFSWLFVYVAMSIPFLMFFDSD